MIRFEPCAPRGPVATMLVPFTIAACALVLASLALAALAASGAPLSATAVDARAALAETLMRAPPLILTALAAGVAFRIRLYNLGGEGQFLAGAFAALAVAASAVPAWASVMLTLMAGAAAGAALMFIAAALKVKRGADEAIVTLLLNFVVLLCVQMALSGEPAVAAAASRFADRVAPHVGLLVALTAAVALLVLVRYTVWGFQIRALADNPEAARLAGIRIARTAVRVGLISGALAGLGGALAVAGGHVIPAKTMYSGLGYAGIVVAVLAGRSVIGVVIAGVLVTGIVVGLGALSGVGGMPPAHVDIFIALLLTLSLAGASLVRYRVIVVWPGKAAR
jgi:general nucleoside transport system permease protein